MTREGKYAEAMIGTTLDDEGCRRMPTVWERAERAMAVADAEQAELRAEVENLRTTVRVDLAYQRRLEATLARVETLVAEEERRIEEANARFADRGVIEPKSGGPLRLGGIIPLRDLRAALEEGSTSASSE